MPINVGDFVYVPASRIGEEGADHAMVRRTVAAVQNRSFSVTRRDQNQTTSPMISTGYAHTDVGVLIVTVGDFATEETTLRPLSKSVLQYLRLLLPDDMVRAVFVRGLQEFRTAWTAHAGAFTHVILIGHSNGSGLLFGATNTYVPVADLVSIVDDAEREYVLLACKSGKANFAKEFSEGAGCRTLIAPFNSIHAAVAAQFAGLYFGERFLSGCTEKAAFNRAVALKIVGSAKYRYWKNGSFEAG